MTQHQLVTVDFHGQSILAATIDGKPYVAMKPIVENIGLQWEAQQKRIQRNPVLKAAMSMMDIPSAGGLQQTTCLPLSMLNGWLFGVDVNRVREEIRPKLIRYQTECFEVLAQHFMPAQRPHNPAIDYDRISPAQKQDLKEIVNAIVQAGVQKYGETWARLQSKFRVNKYEELPASQYEEARRYLIAKLPGGYKGAVTEEATTQALPNMDRTRAAFDAASQAAATVQTAVFNAVLSGSDEWKYSRWMLAFIDDSAKGSPAYVRQMEQGAFVTTWPRLVRDVANGECMCTSVELIEMAAACMQRLQMRGAPAKLAA